MLKVLHVNYSMNAGGTETLLVNLHRKIDSNVLQFDYYCYDEEEQFYEKDIKNLGGTLYHNKRINALGMFAAYRKFSEFLAQHPEYKIVHVHAWYGTIHLLAIRKNQRIGIIHSHNTNSPRLSLRSVMEKIFIYPQIYLADYFFACSPQAGIDRFGKNVNIKFLRNGIATQKYIFVPEVRKVIRENRNINSEHTLILGHVGRFSHQKNHRFLIEVFRCLHAKVHDSKLWLIGAGPLEEVVCTQVHDYELDDAVDFIGITDHVNEYLMGMDVFAFPSIWEGLGIALIEAETSGLPCIASEAIQDEAMITDRIIRLATTSHDAAERWADAIIEAYAHKNNREKYSRVVAEAGFDIETVAHELQDFYLSLVKP